MQCKEKKRIKIHNQDGQDKEKNKDYVDKGKEKMDEGNEEISSPNTLENGIKNQILIVV